MPEVLIVDDDPGIRRFLAATLDGAGYAIREASGGAEAITALERLVPDCLVLDLTMPGVDGFAVLRERRRRGLAPDTRVLVLTGKAGERDFARCWEQGADEYLVKPIDPEDLVGTVQALLQASPAELIERREAELRKAELLERLTTVFSRPRMGSG